MVNNSTHQPNPNQFPRYYYHSNNPPYNPQSLYLPHYTQLHHHQLPMPYVHGVPYQLPYFLPNISSYCFQSPQPATDLTARSFRKNGVQSRTPESKTQESKTPKLHQIFKDARSQPSKDPVPSLSQPQLPHPKDPKKLLIRFNKRIRDLAKKGEIEECKMILCKIFQAGLKPDNYSYNPIITAYVKNGAVNEAFKIIAEMESLSIQFDVAIFNSY